MTLIEDIQDQLKDQADVDGLCVELGREDWNRIIKALQPEDGGITQALVQMARDNAIEECAKVCDARYADWKDSPHDSIEQEHAMEAYSCAHDIRALLSTPQLGKETDGR